MSTPYETDLDRNAANFQPLTPLSFLARAAAVSADDVCDMFFTSGTTGRPKGVMTTHGQNIRVYTAWADGVGLRAGDRYLVVNPMFHTFGYKAGLLACLIRGATIISQPVFDAAEALRLIGRERVTVLPGQGFRWT